MSKLSGCVHKIHTVGNHHGSCGMSEGVRVNVRQIIFFAEFVQPVGDAVRVHGRAVVLGKQKSRILPDVGVTDFLPKLIGTVFFQNSDGFRGQADSPGLTGLGWSDISALFLCVQKRLPDHHNAFVQVNAVPLQSHQFSTAAAGIDENVGHCFPLDRSLFQCFDNVGNLLRLEVVRLMLRHFGRRGFRGGIVRDKHFLMENANICDFMWGYVEGAKSVNSAGTVAISFTGDWYDSAKAKELTLTQAGMGADVVFPASGPSQQGAYEGAAEAGIYSIGVDVDREALYAESNPEWAEHVLTSALKCVDVAVERAIRLFAAGELEMGQEALGIAEGGVDLCMDGNYSDVVPADVQKVIDDAKAAITNGEVTVGTAIGASADEIAEIKAWAGRTE